MTFCGIFPYGTALSLWRMGSRARGFQSGVRVSGFQSTGVPECRTWVPERGEGVPERGEGVPEGGEGVPERRGSRVHGVPERTGSAVALYGLTCSSAHGIFLDQGSSPCCLRCKVDSQPLNHQGSPSNFLF